MLEIASARPVGLNTPSHSRLGREQSSLPNSLLGAFCIVQTIINRFHSQTTNCATPRYLGSAVRRAIIL